MMDYPSYSFRPGALARERRYWIEGSSLYWSDGRRQLKLELSEVTRASLRRKKMGGRSALDKKMMWVLRLYSRSSGAIEISPDHFSRLGSRDDRTSQYLPFVNLLIARLKSVNPELQITAQDHVTLRVTRNVRRQIVRLLGYAIVWIAELPRLVGCDHATSIASRALRALGPKLRPHRIMLANLKIAFPNEPQARIAEIADRAWDNLGRVVAEYPYLDKLWDYSPENGDKRRIIVTPLSLERIAEMRSSSRPVLLFGAHLANWELLGVGLAAFGIKSALLYRRPDFGAAARMLENMRDRCMGEMIPVGKGAASRIRRAIGEGTNIGMLVDQHFAGGIDVSFFGRNCKINPTLGRLARLYNSQIFGARVIRRGGERFEIEVTEMFDPPRDLEGRVDIAATMQTITAIIEGWVREHPEQWLWMHRRWR
jgi:KDO2-lipid IV(A) lauroyltransferase